MGDRRKDRLKKGNYQRHDASKKGNPSEFSVRRCVRSDELNQRFTVNEREVLWTNLFR
jgi:hypothetical protein